MAEKAIPPTPRGAVRVLIAAVAMGWTPINSTVADDDAAVDANPPLPGAEELTVVELSRRYPDGGGYRWTANNSGVPRRLVHQGEQILAKGDGLICCGYTLAVAWDAAEARGLLRKKSVDQMREFQKHWYGSVESNRDKLCVRAVDLLGIGYEVALEDARPGDFVQFWRTNGSGHSVVLLQPILQDGRVVALKYRSAQKSTDGIGDRTEYFADVPEADGRLDRARTYVCRLRAGDEPPGREQREPE